MASQDPAADELLRAKLNLETARIPWLELQRYYARGQVVAVSPQLDLMDVGVALSQDDKSRFQAWMDAGLVGEVDPDQARGWYQREEQLWALVVAPWVLIQDSPGPDAPGSAPEQGRPEGANG
ncbi:MAG: DUF2288 domain-containing protein [Oleiphilaceae bacterium]|nr:DUF2288 domain-containing protein [Oleiphilaceae bacterium]